MFNRNGQRGRIVSIAISLSRWQVENRWKTGGWREQTGAGGEVGGGAGVKGGGEEREFPLQYQSDGGKEVITGGCRGQRGRQGGGGGGGGGLREGGCSEQRCSRWCRTQTHTTGTPAIVESQYGHT